MSISPTGGGFGLQLPSAWDQLQAQDQSLGDIAQQALDESSALSSALSDALANQISGAVNLAADAASTRLGISPNGSSSAPQTASTTLSTPNLSSAAPLLDFETFMASINQAASPDSSVSASNFSTSDPSNGQSGVLGFESLMANLDEAAGTPVAPASNTSSSTPFDLSQYLARLDSLAPPITSAIDVTT